MELAALEALAEHLGGRGCVVRSGYLVYAWGDIARRTDVASAAKPVYAHFLFLALQSGRIPSLDEPIVRWEPRLTVLNPSLGYKDQGITWRHLATQTACYGVQEPPGTAFDYNDWQMALFWDTLFLKVYRADYQTVDETVLRPFLSEPLECEDDPTFLAFGPEDRPGRLAISVRDFARFGLLYLRQGRWKERQLLSGELARMAVSDPLPADLPRTQGIAAEMIPGQRTIGSQRIPDNQTDHFGSYSWLWWVNGVDREGNRRWPGAPLDAYAALGHGGVRGLAVIPSADLVLSWNDARAPDLEGEALRLLKEAVRP